MNKIIPFSLLVLFFGCNYPKKINYEFFSPAKEWLDNNGVHINAHGGGILFHEDLYYWYGEHKIEGEIGNTAQVGVHVYSSKDLYNWTDNGIALKINETDPESEITKGCILERPKVIYNRTTNKFVMWFHLEYKGQGYHDARTGVAVSDSPEGPFSFIKSYNPNAGKWPVNVRAYHKLAVNNSVKDNYCGGPECMPVHVDSLNILGRDFETGQMSRDMNLFVDDDGKAYQLYSSEENSTLHISELSDDFLSHSGNYKRFFVNRFMEAPTIMKNSSGKYFIIASGCTGWAPNAARSAVSDNIFGPWTELENPAIGNNSETTFYSQGTFILPVQGKKDSFIFMADRWVPKNPIDGRYIWLPLNLSDNKITFEWTEKWDLSVFK